jgi:uncharacterized protein (DUF2147 family)
MIIISLTTIIINHLKLRFHMNRKISFTVILALLLAVASTTAKAQSSADDITGKWQNPDNGRLIEISKDNDGYVGKIADGKNDRLPAGTIVLKDIQYSSSGAWKGTMIAPRRGRDIPCTLTLTDKNTLSVKASAMGRSKTFEWTRQTTKE